ncbi:MAG: hypothetical protein KGZ83_18505 [Sulfuricella sp.]|nr:hypothetical protein [Sulfuricella sp.]
MHILIAEKNLCGRNMLERLLRAEGYEVYVAEHGKQALQLLNEVRLDLILMNIFQCVYTDSDYPGNLKVSYRDEGQPLVFATCSGEGEDLGDFLAGGCEYGDVTMFGRLPPKVRIRIMTKIQQLCSALQQSKRQSLHEKNINWQKFISLGGFESAV